jgi:hypothetical protein
VIAVPGRPDVSHLTTGQIDDPMHPKPGMMLLLSAVIGVMSLVFVAGGLLNRRGLDLKWDAAQGRLRLVRAGDE